VTKRQPADDTPPPVVHVEIAAGGHQVIVEAAAALHVVKKAALELFRATDNPNLTRGVGAGFGFVGDPVAADEVPDPVSLPPPVPHWPDEDGA
jgi:hypothetical protein